MDAGSEAAAGPASNDRLLAAQVAQPQTADHLVMKLTRGHSCVLCQQRKVRCDKQKPCANCVKAQVECRVVPPQPPRRRRKKPQERDLIERLKKYEALLAQHGVSFEPIADDFKASDLAEDVADLGQDLTALKTSPESSGPPGSDVDEKSVLSPGLSDTTARLYPCSLPLTRHRNPKYFPYFSHVRILLPFVHRFLSPLVHCRVSHLHVSPSGCVTVTRRISFLHRCCGSERRT